MTKKEMLEKLDEMGGYKYYSQSGAFALIDRLLRGADENDGDIDALTPQLLERVIELWVDCYTDADLLDALKRLDFDPVSGFQFAERYERSDIETAERWEEMKEDCLMYDEENDIIIMSW